MQRNDIDRFIGALSGHFPQGIFMTTANYGKNALRKATTSIPRILTLTGDQVITIMLDNGLGLKPLHGNAQKLVIDPDYFATFEAQKQLLLRKIYKSRQGHLFNSSINDIEVASEEKPIELTPEEDLISLNALGYSLRVDPNRVRRWLESGKLEADDYQSTGERVTYYLGVIASREYGLSLRLKLNLLQARSGDKSFLILPKAVICRNLISQ